MSAEEKIREQRLIEAMRNDYMGKSGKIGCILYTLGEPIKAHSSSMYEVSYMEDPFELEDENEMPVFDEEEAVTIVGHYFDGLKWGIHMEIKYLNDSMTVSWQGRQVFREEFGDLVGYFPDDAWEDQIEKLYNIAYKRQKDKKKDHKEKIKALSEEEKKNWMRKMWERWGFQ